MSAVDLVVRCDADASMGAGHVYRQLALMQAAVRRNLRVALMTSSKTPAHLTRLVRATIGAGHVVLLGDRLDASECATHVEALAPRALIFDGYHFDAEYIAHTSPHARTRVLFEDTGEQIAHVDVVVNVNAGAERVDYQTLMPGAKATLLGVEYTLLREQFVARGQHARRTRERVERLLVTLGGGDMTQELLVALEALDIAQYEGECDVVASPLCDMDALKERARRLPSRVTLHRHVEQMAELMSTQDAAICAAGGTSWELAYSGVPMAQVELFQNQHMVAEYLSRHGVTSSLGDRSTFTPGEVGARVRALVGDAPRRQVMRELGQALVDGRGADRIIEALRL